MPTPYEIITIPDPVLKQVAQPVDIVSSDIKNQITRMHEALQDAGGIGLAANQVAILNRVMIVDVPDSMWQFGEVKNGVKTIERGAETEEEINAPQFMINPEITWKSEEKSVYEEGCLSIPGHFANVIRPAHIKVKFMDEQGKHHEIDSHGLHSHCVQHELDHLNGILFIDHISSLKRNMIIKKFKKQNKIL